MTTDNNGQRTEIDQNRSNLDFDSGNVKKTNMKLYISTKYILLSIQHKQFAIEHYTLFSKITWTVDRGKS